MSTTYIKGLAWILFIRSMGGAALAQDVTLTPTDVANKISTKFAAAEQYRFEGDIEIAKRSGSEKPREAVIKTKVKVALSAPQKYVVRVENDTPSYVLMSDGKRTWAFAPTLNSYVERDATRFALSGDPNNGLELGSKTGRDLAVEFSCLVVPILANLSKSIEAVTVKGSQLTIISKKDGRGRQNLTTVLFDPLTFDIKRLIWMNAVPVQDGDKALVRSDLTFSSFQVGAQIQDIEFTFHPPKDARRVESLPDQGQD